jgi:hypothetical protein
MKNFLRTGARLIRIWLCLLLFQVKISFAQVTVSDDFERASLGTNWTLYFGNGSVEIVNNSDLGFPANNSAFCLAGWTADTFAANQFSEIIISINRPDSVATQAFVRRRSADGARYGFHWNNNFGGRWEIKYDGVPSVQTRLLASVTGTAPIPGDTLRTEISVMTIRGYVNGTLILQVTDTAFATSNPIDSTGVPGLAFVYGATAPVFPAAIIEHWNGGDLNLTSVNTLSGKTLPVVFPNPASNQVNIICKDFSSAELFSVDGKCVTTTVQPTLDVSSIADGIYFLRIIAGNQAWFSKVIKR